MLGKSGATVSTLIEEKVISVAAATLDFTSIPATFRHLRLVIDARGTKVAANVEVLIQVNGDTGANYDEGQHYHAGATAGATAKVAQTRIGGIYIPAASATAGYSGIIDVSFPFYSGVTFSKKMLGRNYYFTDDTIGNMTHQQIDGRWRTANAALVRILVSLAANSFDVGTVATLYGLHGAAPF